MPAFYDLRMGVYRDTETRRFLFLQGPHGPFFAGLAARLRAAGAETWRAGFNAGDAALWRGPGFLACSVRPEDWPSICEELIRAKGITDIVCYGASRPVHRDALEVAAKLGLRRHVFEEGYLRPYWITYERDGANASSPVIGLTLNQMASALEGGRPLLTEAPDSWGDMGAHVFWGAVYHGLLLAGKSRFPEFTPHRSPGVPDEFRLHLKRLATMPVRRVTRYLATLRVRHGGFPYHLVLLQLAHDANFRHHGPFPGQEAFLDIVFKGFAEGAPAHHRLVLKAHPLEDGREPLRPLIRTLAERHGLSRRVHFISGGKLARLLNTAKTAVTVNSTSAEQALWRGLPLKAFGHAVYNRPEFVSDQPVAEFFRSPNLPDRDAYLTYRAFLLATSQVPGGYYAFRSRRKLLRQLPDLMLGDQSPTDLLLATFPTVAAKPQQFRIVP